MNNWEIENGGTLGEGKELTPVQYPRSDATRGQVSLSNKGAASRTDDIAADRTTNTTGDGQSPRREADVNYNAGPYPCVDDNTEGIDERGI